MRIFKAVAAVAAVAAIGLTAISVMAAGAGKAPLYEGNTFTCDTGAEGVGPTFGFAVINIDGKPGEGETVSATISVKNGTPNSEYDLWLNQDPGDCPTLPTGTLTTNGQGNGTAHISEPLVPGAENFWVSATGGGQVLRSPAVTLD